jgi:hypothetical protein
VIEIDMGNMSGVIIRRNPESGVISERFPPLPAVECLLSTPPIRVSCDTGLGYTIDDVSGSGISRPFCFSDIAVLAFAALVIAVCLPGRVFGPPTVGA